MFTGIIAGIGRVAAREAIGGDCRFAIDLGTADFQQPKVGDSIAVNGVCLTATAVTGRQFTADVSVETLAVTTLGGLDAGAPVNIEPALRVGDSLSGHFVSGHVDGIGRLRAAGSAGRSQRLDFDVPAELLRYLARKGSVAVDGVSLTINAVSATGFAVNIVPHTREMTIISAYRTGTAVNIEVDVIARYLERLAGSPQGIDREFLSKHGYSDADQ